MTITRRQSFAALTLARGRELTAMFGIEGLTVLTTFFNPSPQNPKH